MELLRDAVWGSAASMGRALSNQPGRPPGGGREAEMGRVWVLANSPCSQSAKRQNNKYFCLMKYLQKKRTMSMLGKRLISCKVMHSELAAFLKQKKKYKNYCMLL